MIIESLSVGLLSGGIFHGKEIRTGICGKTVDTG